MVKITRLPGKIEVWRVDIGKENMLAISAEEALDFVLKEIEKPAVRIEWINAPHGFEPPGWDGRFPRLPPSATA